MSLIVKNQVSLYRKPLYVNFTPFKKTIKRTSFLYITHKYAYFYKKK